MQPFHISRINTEFGIYRVSGQWHTNIPKVEEIHLKSIDVMGTDGWVSLNITCDRHSKLINNLLPLFLSHLLLKSNLVST